MVLKSCSDKIMWWEVLLKLCKTENIQIITKGKFLDLNQKYNFRATRGTLQQLQKKGTSVVGKSLAGRKMKQLYIEWFSTRQFYLLLDSNLWR